MSAADSGAPKVSGSLASHYAPLKPLQLISPPLLDAAVAQALSSGLRVAVWSIECPQAGESRIDWLARPPSVQATEHDLYRVLRELDTRDVDLILVESPPSDPAWMAVNDRLQRAAAPR